MVGGFEELKLPGSDTIIEELRKMNPDWKPLEARRSREIVREMLAVETKTDSEQISLFKDEK